MNEELIQKLVDQCVDKRERDGRTVEVLQSRKFAELIVQECVDWIDGSPSTDAGQLVLTKSFIIANIKEYFGVE